MKNQRMTSRARPGRRNSARGFTIYEVLIVMGIIAVISAVALPQLLGSSRLISSNGIPREIVAYLRFARQEAISQMVAFTCRYDHAARTITIINHRERGITYDPATDTMVRLPGNTAPNANQVADVTVETIPLSRTGVPAADISFGRMDGNPATTPLPDGATMVTLPGSNQISITFQPDGSVVDSLNAPINRSLFLYNQQAQQQTAFAITVLGTTGRVKQWRYNSNVNLYQE